MLNIEDSEYDLLELYLFSIMLTSAPWNKFQPQLPDRWGQEIYWHLLWPDLASTPSRHPKAISYLLPAFIISKIYMEDTGAHSIIHHKLQSRQVTQSHTKDYHSLNKICLYTLLLFVKPKNIRLKYLHNKIEE